MSRISEIQNRFGVATPSTAGQATSGQAFGQILAATTGDASMNGGYSSAAAGGATGDVVKIQDITRTPTAIRRIVGTDAAGASRPSYDPMAMRLALSQSAASIGDTSDTNGVSGVSGTSRLSSLSPSTPYSQLFQQAGARHGVDPSLLAAVARAESGL